jgi:hypothetical protein
MKIYADTSFLVKLLGNEAGSDDAVAEFQRLDRPRLPFFPLHRLETAVALRQKAFHARRAGAAEERSSAVRIRNASLARVVRWTERGWLVEQSADFEGAVRIACELAERHVDRTGGRSFDLLHVAHAILLKSEILLTMDRIQGEIARSEGLEVPDLGQ